MFEPSPEEVDRRAAEIWVEQGKRFGQRFIALNALPPASLDEVIADGPSEELLDSLRVMARISLIAEAKGIDL